MSIFSFKSLALGLVSLTSVAAWAVPAKPGLIPVTQEDGSVIEIRLVGDERSHYTLSEDGYLIAPVNNTYYYSTISDDAKIVPSEIKVTPAAARTAEAKAFLEKIDLSAQASKMKARDAVMAQSRRMASAANFGKPAPAKTVGIDEHYPLGPGLFPGCNFPAYGAQKGLVILVQYADEKFHHSDPHDYFN
ncbi:MAG: hypothetical protein K2K55_00760, partial [Duncaniella sp.]|nr:hypothetical protein [Duncaniella sp.]